MKINLSWLKDYIAFGSSAEELKNRLTMAGLEVEKVSLVDGDTIFEVEITPNRPDCLNMLGIAREVSAIFNKPRKIPTIKEFSSKNKCSVEIADKEGCHRYIGTIVNNVKIDKTPAKIQ